uniref:V-type proton ATPase subunit S1/VOA1 transmembrane domain-containing protein n=1 Tax=Cryptomonas curvata TaxID=233186 RepID=A0A7S0LX96_9CRYP|mmetsp:Transcript_11777/g.25267  ORF Transcript_11777/g.25267 Transcript_11777/m.25267 type:complete len:170 (+) Transcript_11777:32-541(+)
MRLHSKLCLFLVVGLLLQSSVDASRKSTKHQRASSHPALRFSPSASTGILADSESDGVDAAAEYTGSVYAMYTGILVLFGIMWTIYFFLYCWQYESFGNYSFFVSSYIILVVLISLGLSKYFTGSILTALLWSVIFISISSAGFMAMGSITSPDRFEGDKSNMGRTKLE